MNNIIFRIILIFLFFGLIIFILFSIRTNFLRLVIRHPDCAGSKIFDVGAYGGDPWSDCHWNLAKTNDDYRICYYLFLDDFGNKGKCLKDIAIKDKNPLICDKIGNIFEKEIKGQCYYDMAIVLNDISYCDKVKLPSDIYCYADLRAISGESDQCFNLPIDQKNECLGNAAVAKKDPSICSKTTSPDPKNYDSQFFCIIKVSQELKDSSVCNFLIDSNKKESCLNYFK